MYVEEHTFDQDIYKSEYVHFDQVLMIDTDIVDEDHFKCLNPDNLNVKECTALGLGDSPETQENNVIHNAYLMTGTMCTAAFGLWTAA